MIKKPTLDCIKIITFPVNFYKVASTSFGRSIGRARASEDEFHLEENKGHPQTLHLFPHYRNES
jgi:hypothetical protein